MSMSDISPRKDRRAAILQSCYIPWKGYFDIIASVDVFVVYDDVKYSKNHWHNRNLIKTQHGLKWLTVPVSRGYDKTNSIDSMRITRPFADKHWRSIAQSYARAPFFKRYSEKLEVSFKAAGGLERLSAVNILFLKFLCEELGIDTEIISSRDLGARGTRTERLANICQEVGANIYLSGPSAKAYIEEERFAKSGIDLEWMDYSNYSHYSQLHGTFAHGVTILDLILNKGPDARAFLKSRVRTPVTPRSNPRQFQARGREADPALVPAQTLHHGHSPNLSAYPPKPRRVSIVQSCYIPWKGFFDLIGQCDEYVIFDSVQYVKRHWHNRNRIKTANGLEWLTIPVVSKGRFEQPIDEVEIEKPWADKHWRTLELAYKRAPFFQQYAPAVKGWYELADKKTKLTDVNAVFLSGICGTLGLKTRITRDTAYPAHGVKTERLLGIVRAVGADRYLSGPSARTYLDESTFRTAGITPEWMDYQGYPEYPQLHGGFEHAVSVLDLLFNTGPGAPRYLTRTAAPTAAIEEISTVFNVRGGDPCCRTTESK
jgi:WbqC-like protein family